MVEGPSVPPQALALAEDLRLMQRVANKDPHAERAIAQRLMSRVRRLTRSLASRAADSDDAAQACMMQILQSAGSYRGDCALEGWADRVAARTTLRLARSQKTDAERRDTELDLEGVPLPASGPPARESIARSVEAYLELLPEPLRTVLVLRHALDYSIAEIADELGVSPNTVKDRLLRGRELMRRHIRRDLVVAEVAGAKVDA
jgi:RNA polymerase sigma-70 factor (ECF subfamily)